MEPQMKNKKIKILLIASLALNLAFFSTYIYKRINKKPSRERRRISLFEEKFKLKDKQKIEIEDLLAEYKIKLVNTKHDMLEKRMAIIEMAGDPDTEIQKIWTSVGELNKLEGEMNISFVKVLLEIGNVLDSTQRINFLLRLSKHWFFLKRDYKGKRYD